MHDQADTLRKLMEERDESRPWGAELSCPVFSISGSESGLALPLSRALSALGSQVLMVRTSAKPFIQSRRNLDIIGDDFEVTDFAMARSRILALIERASGNVDAVIVENPADSRVDSLHFHGLGFESVVVVSPDARSMGETYALIRNLRKRGVDRVQVIVNGVTESRQGIQAFHDLQELSARYAGTRLVYLGQRMRDEKNRGAWLVPNEGNLLESYRDSSIATCRGLELVAKRMVSERLGWGISSSTERDMIQHSIPRMDR